MSENAAAFDRVGMAGLSMLVRVLEIARTGKPLDLIVATHDARSKTSMPSGKAFLRVDATPQHIFLYLDCEGGYRVQLLVKPTDLLAWASRIAADAKR